MITGATGHIGKELVKELAERKVAFRAMVRSLSKGLNRQIEYVDVPSQGMLETLLSVGLPQWQAEGLIEDYEHYRRGEAATIATGVRDATGAVPRSFDQFVSDYSSAFS